MLFWLSLLPIVLIFVGIVGLNFPSKHVAPVSWAASFAIAVFTFGSDTGALLATSLDGLVDAFRIVVLIFAAFTLLMVMTGTGAMETIKQGLSRVTGDMRLMVLLLAIPFGTFLEGAAGAGSPAALAAPFLVGLGLDPLLAAAACLIGNSCPVSWGGAGVTTVMGASASGLDFQLVSAMTGRMASLGYILMAVLMIVFVFGLRATKGIWRHILVLGVLMAAVNFSVSNLLMPITELTSLVGGLIGTGIFCFYLSTLDKGKVPGEFRFGDVLLESDHEFCRGSFFKAMLPYVFLCVALITVRLSFPLKVLVSFGGGYLVWVSCVIFSSAVFAAVIFGKLGNLPGHALSAGRKVIPALISMGFLLAMVNCMKSSGQISTLAKTLSAAAGGLYPMAAVLIGQIGSFITGTNLGSNLMFNPLHIEAAHQLSLNIIPVAAAQNTGGAIGNMICPNNVVAVCACVAILGQEGKVMRKALVPSLCLLGFYAGLAMVYTYLIFPA